MEHPSPEQREQLQIATKQCILDALAELDSRRNNVLDVLADDELIATLEQSQERSYATDDGEYSFLCQATSCDYQCVVTITDEARINFVDELGTPVCIAPRENRRKPVGFVVQTTVFDSPSQA